MNTAVIYKSKTGFTKKYAEWIAEELDADLFPLKKARGKLDAVKLRNYDAVIFGGSLHAAGICGVDFLKDKLDCLRGKTIIVFATGASPYREEVMTEVRNNNFTPMEQEQVRFYYFRGGFDFSKLNLFNKLLMTLMKWKIRRKSEEERTPDEKGMLAAFDKPVDFTKKENIRELIQYVLFQ